MPSHEMPPHESTPHEPEQHEPPQDAALRERRAEAESARLAKAEQRSASRAEAAELKAARTAKRQAKGPGAWRTYVLPILRLAVIAAIAIALVKIAFFPDASAESAQGWPPPTADMQEPTVAAAIATVQNDVTVDGSVMADGGVPIRATLAGTVTQVLGVDGQQVAEGDALYRIRQTVEATVPNTDGTMPPPTVRNVTVTAPAAGVLSGFEVLKDEMVEVGGETGAVAPPTFHVEAALTAADQYRLTSQPTEATVSIDGGPAPFACTDLTITQPTAPAQGADSQGDPSQTGATLTCAVPADVRVFSGLAADITIAVGVAENVLTLPTTAVTGSADTGIAYRIDGGEQVEVPVQLGMNDGEIVEITGGLAEGDEVMQFAPGAVAVDPCADPMTADPMLCGTMP